MLMKHRFRIILAGLTVLSLLLWLTTLALWMWSYTSAMAVGSQAGRLNLGSCQFYAFRGRLFVEHGVGMPTEIQRHLQAGGALAETQAPEFRWDAGGVFWADMVSDPRPMFQPYVHLRMFAIQCWLVAVITGLLPALWIALACWPAHPGEGYCRRCGYDLRATPTRCPECGTPVSPAQPQVARRGGD